MNNHDTLKLIKSFKSKLVEQTTESALIEAKNIFVKKNLSPLYDDLKVAPGANKRDLGIFINQFKNEINDAFEEAKNNLLEKIEKEEHKLDYNINVNSANLSKGQFTPISLITNEVISFFDNMNFDVVCGNEVVKIKHNFDSLNIDPTHPGRDKKDSYYFNDSLMLRSHCTATTSLIMENNKSEDIRVLSYGNVYRNDDDDLTHSHQFNQIDIVWVKEGLSIRNLKWLIENMLKHLFGQDAKTRFRLSHFPFTEPSFEVDVTCLNCGGSGCPMCKQTGWIEILGAGMLHKNVMEAANIKIKTGLAAGFGVDRLAMLKYKISDIRLLYTNDFRFLNQFKKEEK